MACPVVDYKTWKTAYSNGKFSGKKTETFWQDHWEAKEHDSEVAESMVKRFWAYYSVSEDCIEAVEMMADEYGMDTPTAVYFIQDNIIDGKHIPEMWEYFDFDLE